MKNIKELALKVAGMDDLMGPRDTFAFTKERMADFATRLIAAYLKEQEPVAWIYCPECGSEEIHYEEGGHKQCANCHQEWFSDIDYSDVVQSNLSKLFTAPPEPAPQTDGSTTVSAPDQERMSRSACAAPSSEEVQRMIGWLRVELGHLVTCQQAADLIERLAARVPDERIATLEQQNAELAAALERARTAFITNGDRILDAIYDDYINRLGMSVDFKECYAAQITGVLSKGKQP